MQITPRVFVSAATSDLKSARGVVNSLLNELECLPVDQAHFGTQCGEVRDMLREKIAGCQAVVHLVGRDYGQEPGDRAPGAPRRSWTQTEYDLALQLGKKLYVIVCDATYPFEPRSALEPADSVDLQARHVEAVLKGKHLWHRVRSVEELRECLVRLKLPLDEVRRELRRQQTWQRVVAAVAAGVAVLAFNWLVLRLAALGATVEETARNVQATIETTGASVQQTIAVGQQEQGARLDRQSDQLELVKLGLQELATATRELTSQLDDGADRTALISHSPRTSDGCSTNPNQSWTTPGFQCRRCA